MTAWPPRTGVANVYEGVIIARSSGNTEIALTFSATEASNRPILMARARATSLPAVVEVRYQVDDSEKPGWDGVAARLPKDPGVQKLSPVSSAQARARAQPRRRRAPSVAATRRAAKSRPAHPIPSSPLRPSGVPGRARVLAAAAAAGSAGVGRLHYTNSRARGRGRRHRRIGSARRMLAIVAGRKHRRPARRPGEEMSRHSQANGIRHRERQRTPPAPLLLRPIASVRGTDSIGSAR